MTRGERIMALEKAIKAQERRVFNAQTYYSRASHRHYLRALCVELEKLKRGE